jgi:hypothetical protein
VIEHTGKLSHFDHGKSTSEKLELPKVTWLEKEDEGGSELAPTSNANLWLDWDGVLRFDGARWSAVAVGTDGLDSPQLIGASGDRVWSALESLGNALAEQDRYERLREATRRHCTRFRGGGAPIEAWRKCCCGSKGPEKALEWIEKIIYFNGLSFTQRKMNGRPQDDYWALRAWALARLGRRQEVDDAVENALKATDKNCRIGDDVLSGGHSDAGPWERDCGSGLPRARRAIRPPRTSRGAGKARDAGRQLASERPDPRVVGKIDFPHQRL